VPLRTHSLQDPRIPFALASNKYRLAPPRTSDRCTRILHPLALHLHDRETNTERLCATAAPPRHSRHSASPRMTTPESRQGLESPAAMTTDEHEWLPTRTPSTDDAVSSSVSRSTAAEKRTNSEIREKRNVSMADDAHTVNGEGEDGRDARRANRRSSRQTSGHSFERPPLKKRLTELFVAERPIRNEPTVAASLRAIVFASWLNVLLVFIPVGWALHFTKQNDTIIFVFTFLAIIPLAKLLGFGTEELALRVGQTLGGLMNATLGNAVELIVAIIALAKCELQVVQSSLLGSILSNLLLVLGMCFFAGGIKYSEQGFKVGAAQLNSSLLVISVIAVLLPAAFNAAFSDNLSAEADKDRILKMSRGTAVILLVIYLAYLAFQLFSHKHMFVDGNVDPNDPTVRDGRAIPLIKRHRAWKPAKSVAKDRQVEEAANEEEEEELPELNKWVALALLVVVTVLVAVTAEFLVSSINGLTEQHPEISTEWVGLILLPIVGNAAEHVTAVSVSVHDKIDLSMGVAVGSSIQIALFVIPFMVILGWIMNKPLSLLFDPFESVTLFLSVLIVNYTIQDGRSNWRLRYLGGLVLVLPGGWVGGLHLQLKARRSAAARIMATCCSVTTTPCNPMYLLDVCPLRLVRFGRMLP
ncbi:hypothetical protein BMF94_3537, partial [Rhodotorula taiwanensis]